MIYFRTFSKNFFSISLFRFHTAFIDQIPSTTGKKKYKLRLTREEIDNPHKPKTWNTYQEDFAIELYFTETD